MQSETTIEKRKNTAVAGMDKQIAYYIIACIISREFFTDYFITKCVSMMTRLLINSLGIVAFLFIISS